MRTVVVPLALRIATGVTELTLGNVEDWTLALKAEPKHIFVAVS